MSGQFDRNDWIGAWIEMRACLLGALPAIEEEHDAEIQQSYEQSEAYRDLVRTLEENSDISPEDHGDYIESGYEDWRNMWLIEQGYAYWHPVHGLIDVKWKTVPQENWPQEIPDPFVAPYPYGKD